MFSAAMVTSKPQAPAPWFVRKFIGGDGRIGKRPTEFMVHVAGHGPRRVYQSDFTGRHFILIERRRVLVDPKEIVELIRSSRELALEKEKRDESGDGGL